MIGLERPGPGGRTAAALAVAFLLAACSGQGRVPVSKDAGGDRDKVDGVADLGISEMEEGTDPGDLQAEGGVAPADGGWPDATSETPCTPQCEGKECGDDGCGGDCGTCPAAAPVCKDFACEVECIPDCEGKECGSDGCDGDCGACPEAAPYCVDNLCAVTCDPDCEGKECGEDGCGGTCGACGPQTVCSDGQCVCQPACEGKECGDDDCGGSCGDCPDDMPFCVEGQCTGECETDCVGKECGEDGCGDVCGECAGAQEVCADGQCVCQPACGPGACGDDGCGGDCGDCACDETCVGGMCTFVGCGEEICGEDGCGESCGGCPQGSVCTDEGTCMNQCYLNCEGKECGSDGCGGLCGICQDGVICTDDGQCVWECVQDCVGKECGNDGCGGSCGVCGLYVPGGPYCIDGQCENECEGECGMKVCGDDGCGSSCGDCDGDLLCTAGGTCGGVCAFCSYADYCYDLDFSDVSLANWAVEAVLLVQSLGFTEAPTGGAMLKLTTGEGLTEYSSDAIFQDCLPGGEYMLFIRWRLYSEEFKEWCGSLYQDSMAVFIESELAAEELLSHTIDDLCPPEECSGCGSAYDGLIQSDVIFDQGGVWNTHWREEWLPVTLPDGEVFDIHLALEDAGDGIYDTVLLVDRLRLLPCEEACEQLECGENPCGESCGDCDAGGECLDGVCCYPTCDGKECGDDGCGGNCGSCGSLTGCSADGTCECKYDECDDGCCASGDVCSTLSGKCCHPVCVNNQCGDDGCGGMCPGVGVECCTVVEDCDDSDDCTIDQCQNNVCHYEPSGSPECCEPFLWERDFDDETEQGFTLENSGMPVPGMEVGWQVTGGCGFHSSPAALYFGSVGNPFFGECTYGGAFPWPVPMSGTATSEEIHLPDGGPILLSFWVVADIQAGAGVNTLDLELLTLLEESVVWGKTDIDWGFGGEWHKVTVDLSAWAGYMVHLRWSFDAVGGQDPGSIGVLVDDIQVTADCD